MQGTKTDIKYRVDENGCHICTSHNSNTSAYPQICRDGKTWIMSRYIYTQQNGEIPKGKVVRHTCDNNKCINPNHLILGTVADNNNDRVIRGRNSDTNGENNPCSKLTAAQAKAIFESPFSIPELSRLYNVSQTAIHQIKNKKRWLSIHQ